VGHHIEKLSTIGVHGTSEENAAQIEREGARGNGKIWVGTVDPEKHGAEKSPKQLTHDLLYVCQKAANYGGKRPNVLLINLELAPLTSNVQWSDQRGETPCSTVFACRGESKLFPDKFKIALLGKVGYKELKPYSDAKEKVADYDLNRLDLIAAMSGVAVAREVMRQLEKRS